MTAVRYAKKAYELPSMPGESWTVRFAIDEQGFILHGIYNENRELVEIKPEDYDWLEAQILKDEQ